MTSFLDFWARRFAYYLVWIEQLLKQFLTRPQACKFNFYLVAPTARELYKSLREIHNLDRFPHVKNQGVSVFANRKRLQYQ